MHCTLCLAVLLLLSIKLTAVTVINTIGTTRWQQKTEVTGSYDSVGTAISAFATILKQEAYQEKL